MGGNTAKNSCTGRIATVQIYWDVDVDVDVEGAVGMMDRGEEGDGR